MVLELKQVTSIARPAENVWAALADFGEISRWAPNVDHSCLTSDAGERVGNVRRVQVGRNALLETVIEWVPETRLAYSIEGLPRVVRSVVNKWELDGQGQNTTVTLRTSIDTGPRPPQQVIARIVGKVLTKASVQMLSGLKSHLEEGPA